MTRGGFKVGDYLWRSPQTFQDLGALAPEQAQLELIWRECRGIKFTPHGDIVARPLFKFQALGKAEGVVVNHPSMNEGASGSRSGG